MWENLKHFNKKLPELVIQFRIAEYKLHVKTSFLYINTNLTERKIRKEISSTTVTKRKLFRSKFSATKEKSL